jgi:thioredoxin 2
MNRVPAWRAADSAVCGACQSALPPLAEPLPVDTDLFDAIVQGSPVPVLVDFWASWCGPCKMAAPEVDALAKEMAGRALILKVDTEAFPELAERFNVYGIPNFVVLRDRRVVSQQAGVAPRAQMRKWLESAGARAA